MTPKDVISLLLGIIGCCIYGYFEHIDLGINNNILTMNQSVKVFFSYLNHWTLMLTLLLFIVYVCLKNQNQE